MTDFFVSLVAFLGVFTVVVVVHEMGHYLVARWCRVEVETFSVGFGKQLFGWRWRGTMWRVGAIPLGGYVGFGEEGDAFLKTGAGRRFAIAVAGPFANFIFTIVVLALVAWSGGVQVPSSVVGGVQEGSAAEAAGLQAGDVIVGIDGEEVETFDVLARAVLGSGGSEALALEVEREGRLFAVEVVPSVVEGVPRLGVSSGEAHTVRYGLVQAMGYGVERSWQVLSLSLSHVWRALWSDELDAGLAGPLGIARITGDAAEQGLGALISLTAVLSMSLGFFNLLPLPVLDGGHAAFAVVEMVRRKPVGEKVQRVAAMIGVAALVSLIIVVTVGDIQAFFVGSG